MISHGFDESLVILPCNIDGQTTYWRIDRDNVAQLPPQAGAEFPGEQGLLRIFGINGNKMSVLDERGTDQLVFLPSEPSANVRYQGLRGAGGAVESALPVVSFRLYKPTQGAETRERDERVVAVTGVGYGRFMPGHEGEAFAPYLRGYLLGSCAVGALVRPESYPTPRADAFRNFSMPRMGMFGNPGDPENGAAIRARWGLSHIPE